MPLPLNPKQEKFCHEYLVDLNATKAAIRAGYSEKTAAAQSSRLLSDVKISDYIATLQKPVLDNLEITRERVLRTQAAMAFSNMENYVSLDADGQPFIDLTAATRDQWGAVKKIKVTKRTVPGKDKDTADTEIEQVELELYDRRQANETLMKHLNLLAPDIHENNTVNFNVNLLNISEEELVKRMAFMLFRDARAAKPKVPRIQADKKGGGSNGGSSAVNSATGKRDKSE